MDSDELGLVHSLVLALDEMVKEYESLYSSGACINGVRPRSINLPLANAKRLLRDVQELLEAALDLREDERRVKEMAMVAYQAMPAAKGRAWVEGSDHPLQVDAIQRARKFLMPSKPRVLQPFQRICTRCKKTFMSKHHRDVCASCTY